VIGRSIAIGFGIAIVFPMLIYYGVSTFSPAPKPDEYVAYPPIERDATAEEREIRQAKINGGQKALKEAQSIFAKRLFYVAAPAGYLAILIGGLVLASAVGTGLIFGGIFSVIDGYWVYWGFIPDWERFVSLLVAAAILLFIAYRKVPKSNPTS
jgi:hypothetical protein